MENTTTKKQTKPNTKKNTSSAIRFQKEFMTKIKRLVSQANRKQFGRKVKPHQIITHLFELVDESIIQKAISRAQEDSLTLKHKEERFLKESANKFGESPDKIKETMMKLYEEFKSKEQMTTH